MLTAMETKSTRSLKTLLWVVNPRLEAIRQSSVGEKVLDNNGQYITYGGQKMVAMSAETYFPVPGMNKMDSIPDERFC